MCWRRESLLDSSKKFSQVITKFHDEEFNDQLAIRARRN